MTTAQKPDDKTKLLSKTWTSQVLYSDLASGSGISPSNETGSSLKNGISSPFDDTMDEPFSRQISADKQKESETNGIVLPNDVAKRIKTSITSALSKAESLALLIKTMAIYTFAFGMAFVLPGLGVSLIHLAVLLEVHVEDFSLIFLCEGFGLIVGAISSALILRNKFPYEPQFALALLIAIITHALSVWVNSFVGFGLLRFLTAVGIGFVDNGLNTYLFFLWAGSTKLTSIMHAKMLFASIGGLLCPLVLSIFLVDLPNTDSNNACIKSNQQPTAMPTTTLSTTLLLTPLSTEGRNNNCTISLTPKDVALVKWSFVFASCCMIVPMVLMAVTSFLSISTRIIDQSSTNDIDLASNEQLPASKKMGAMTYLFVGNVALLAGLFMSMVAIISQYLQTFVVLGFNWNVETGAFLITIHNGGYLIGRIIGIPLSLLIRNSVLIAASLILGTIGIFILLFAGTGVVSDKILWVGVFFIGMGKSLVTSGLLIWTNQITGLLTPAQSAALNVAMSVGFMVGPVLTSAIYSTYAHMSMVYVSLSNNISQHIVFVILLLIEKKITQT